MQIKFGVGNHEVSINRFDHRGHLNRKELKTLLRNFKLSKNLFYSEIGVSVDPAAWLGSAVAQIAVTKAMIVENPTLGSASVAIEEARLKKYKTLPKVSLNIFDDQSNWVNGIDLWNVKFLVHELQTQEGSKDQDFVVLNAEKTSWG